MKEITGNWGLSYKQGGGFLEVSLSVGTFLLPMHFSSFLSFSFPLSASLPPFLPLLCFSLSPYLSFSFHSSAVSSPILSLSPNPSFLNSYSLPLLSKPFFHLWHQTVS